MKKVTIVGGGVIGLFTAYYLTEAGVPVQIIDNGTGESGCSHGNAGMIVPSHIIPLAAPGVISKSLKWLLDATSPFYVKPKLDLGLIKWGLAFQKAANPQIVEAAKPVLRDISLLSKELYQSLAKEFNFSFEEKGLLMLCQKQETYDEEIEIAHQAIEIGIKAEILDVDGIKKLEPNSNPAAMGAVFFPGDAHCNPSILMQELKNYLLNKSVEFFYKTEVVDFKTNGDTVTEIIINQDDQESGLEVDQVIICGGSWSQNIAKKLESYLPLQAGKGYSFVRNQNKDTEIQVPSILVEGKVAVTPFEGGNVRFGGTMEIGGINDHLNMKRVQGIVNCVNEFYPQLNLNLPSKEEIWYGFRPCSPDGLPYIGKMRKFENVLIGSGHAMMGLSMGPATGKLLADNYLGIPPKVSSQLLSPSRFE
ncbi:D-amino-acid dehydrogenase [Spirosomataceae bacterium TFI 002]|nr:D-amino-acid dehydrogenase [Spirosomataceae bacterium TFI 002]